MERFAREQAHTLSLEEIQDTIDAEVSNPCIERLIYVETRATDKRERKIFPVYPFDLMEGADGKVLVLFVVQYIMKQYTTACITIPVSDIGVKCRFWNLPPTEDILDKMPMADSSEVQ